MHDVWHLRYPALAFLSYVCSQGGRACRDLSSSLLDWILDFRSRWPGRKVSESPVSAATGDLPTLHCAWLSWRLQNRTAPSSL